MEVEGLGERMFHKSDCKCKSEQRQFKDNFKKKRVERLRFMNMRGTKGPNLRAKVWASRLADEVDGKMEMPLPDGCTECENVQLGIETETVLPPLQYTGMS